MPDISKYAQFIERMQKLREQPLPAELLACIDKESLMAIVDNITKDMSNQKRFKGLKPYDACRVKRKHSGLARAYCVLRDPLGNYQCILETKSKNAANKKQTIETAEGGFKIGKPAWRLDGKNGPSPHFSLLLMLKEKGQYTDINDKDVIKKLKALKAEIELPWEFDKEVGLQRNTLGEVYENSKGLVASIYSKKGIPLNNALKNKELSVKEREEIGLSLLKTLTKLHEREIVFQDLKPANVLLFRKKNGHLKVRLSDPGHVSRPSKKETSVATSGYESPEIAIAHSVKDTYYHNYFKKRYAKEGLSLGKKMANKIERELKKKGALKDIAELKKSGLKAAKENDMWAMGVTLFKLFNNRKPRTIPTDPRLAGFFAAREERLTAAQALAQWTEPKRKKRIY